MKKSKPTILLQFASNLVCKSFFANYDYLDGFQAENKQFWEGLFSKVKSENHEKVQNPQFCSDLSQIWFVRIFLEIVTI